MNALPAIELGSVLGSLGPLGPLGALLAPPLCWSCRQRARPGEPLCVDCRRTLRPLGPQPIEVAGVKNWSAVAYEGAARELVRALKYRGAMAVADSMAAQIAARAPRALLHGATLVPVPLHPARVRRRGFNQAELLARAIGRRAGRPVARCLTRRGPPTAQVGRGRAERLTGIGETIQASGIAAARRAVLVDDVATTGATLAACAAALRTAGASEIGSLTYARALGR